MPRLPDPIQQFGSNPSWHGDEWARYIASGLVYRGDGYTAEVRMTDDGNWRAVRNISAGDPVAMSGVAYSGPGTAMPFGHRHYRDLRAVANRQQRLHDLADYIQGRRVMQGWVRYDRA